MEPLLTLEEACNVLRISRRTMMHLLSDFKIAGTKVGGNWKFTKECLEDYVKSRTIKTKKFAA